MFQTTRQSALEFRESMTYHKQEPLPEAFHAEATHADSGESMTIIPEHLHDPAGTNRLNKKDFLLVDFSTLVPRESRDHWRSRHKTRKQIGMDNEAAVGRIITYYWFSTYIQRKIWFQRLVSENWRLSYVCALNHIVQNYGYPEMDVVFYDTGTAEKSKFPAVNVGEFLGEELNLDNMIDCIYSTGYRAEIITEMPDEWTGIFIFESNNCIAYLNRSIETGEMMPIKGEQLLLGFFEFNSRETPRLVTKDYIQKKMNHRPCIMMRNRLFEDEFREFLFFDIEGEQIKPEWSFAKNQAFWMRRFHSNKSLPTAEEIEDFRQL